MKKDTILQIRLTESQKEFFKQNADEYDLSMSEFFKLQSIMFFKLKDFDPEIFERLMSAFKSDIYRF